MPYPVMLVIGEALLGSYRSSTSHAQPGPGAGGALPLAFLLRSNIMARDFKRWPGPIGALATGLVVATTCASSSRALADPEAAVGRCVASSDQLRPTQLSHRDTRRIRMPRRLIAVLENEGLINDVSGLLLYNFAVAATVASRFSWLDAAGDFVLIAAVASAAVGIRPCLRVDSAAAARPLVEVLLTLTLPYLLSRPRRRRSLWVCWRSSRPGWCARARTAGGQSEDTSA